MEREEASTVPKVMADPTAQVEISRKKDIDLRPREITLCRTLHIRLSL
jgi:hypothetical protein